MANFIAKQKCWVVVSVPAAPTLCEVEEGETFTSKNEVVEVFYDEHLAHARMQHFIPGWQKPSMEPSIASSELKVPPGMPSI